MGLQFETAPEAAGQWGILIVAHWCLGSVALVTHTWCWDSADAEQQCRSDCLSTVMTTMGSIAFPAGFLWSNSSLDGAQRMTI